MIPPVPNPRPLPTTLPHAPTVAAQPPSPAPSWSEVSPPPVYCPRRAPAINLRPRSHKPSESSPSPLPFQAPFKRIQSLCHRCNVGRRAFSSPSRWIASATTASCHRMSPHDPSRRMALRLLLFIPLHRPPSRPSFAGPPELVISAGLLLGLELEFVKMAGVLRKILPVAAPVPREDGNKEDDDDSYSLEYSMALEYSGPPVSYSIPRAVPVDVKKIPVAVTVQSAALSSDASPLPVIQPIVRSSASDRSKERRCASDIPVCLDTNGVSDANHFSYESSNMVDNSSSVVGCANGEDRRHTGGSGRSRLSTVSVGSRRLSGSLLELPGVSNEDAGGDFEGTRNPDNFEEIESESSDTNSSEIFSGREEDNDEVAPSHVRRPSIVTFRDPESNGTVTEDSDLSESESSVPERQMAVRPGKKGTCYRCMKGNRFTEKEVCIVCGAKYCYNCVVRAMGSMPEGRKCITCIGQRIDETKRKTLGKCSRLLKQLLPDAEVKQIMISERSCAVNQLPPDLIYVNRQRLSEEELLLLQTCQHPPTKLKPGYYWYDKVSGYWGKEGHKPCQIISPQLTVGGHIQEDASNGNTNILINSRKITKSELLMLQLAGVKCEGATHLWVSADGSYQEEGMNNIKGNIWKSTKARLVCPILSLPTPPHSANPSVKEENGPNFEVKTFQKLLLVGHEKSGTSTIFKQAKIVYHVPFSENERQSIKFMIQTNLYAYLGILLEGRERFEEQSLAERRKRSVNRQIPSGTEGMRRVSKGGKVDKDRCKDHRNDIFRVTSLHQFFVLSSDTIITEFNTGEVDDTTIYTIRPRLKAFSDWLLKVMLSGNLETMVPAAREYAPFVEDLWKDPAIQATYNRRTELNLLPRVATYFLERAAEIVSADYNPSDMDILYAEGMTSSRGLSFMEFSFPQSTQDGWENIGYQHDPLIRYQLIRAHPSILGGNCRWLEMFEDIDIVLFCVSVTDYNEFYRDNNGVVTNKMMASKQLFERIVTYPAFEDKKFLLILNKFDLLEEKILDVPLTVCEWFHDFHPVIGHDPSSNRSTNPSLAHRAFQYMAVKFKRLFHSLTDKKLYVSLVTGLEPDNVDEALRFAREILKWNHEEANYPNNEMSSTSIEASSSS
ncbi:hypothetical protein Tsubulata_030333 [Turnera subulata]|uniref:Extra-large guanine nucleotide-binding protein 1 n=1 Tax=Turnera subulata TaxID=218843 RepID=A0A9Q0G7Q0_9ROSI|nr:hypothetical protein Tsubulata_030333 [Turnera subulata]